MLTLKLPNSLQTLRYLEWTFLLLTLVGEVLTSHLRISQFAPLPLVSPVVWSCSFLLLFGLLSLVFPLNRPYWQRLVYVLLEIFLVTAACLVSGVRFFPFIYTTVVAKSCFLLNRRGVIFTVVLTVLAFVVGMIWRVQSVILSRDSLAVLERNASLIAFNYSLIFVASIFFVTMLSFALIAEQKSRQRAEALALEVEVLATRLERNRIAREIHDALGHTLTSLNIQLEVAQKLRQRDPTKAAQALDTAKQLASQSLLDVRRALQTLRRSDFKLEEAVAVLVAQVEQQHPGLEIQLLWDLPQLPLVVSHQLYSIILESLTNMQKYAQATKAQVRGYKTEAGIRVNVMDNGQGFDPQASRSGWGLMGMEERVNGLGGEFQVCSSPGAGTQIQVMIPWDRLQFGEKS